MNIGMEMPKGWERLSDSNGRIFTPDPYLSLNTAHALYLIKEMAETLERIDRCLENEAYAGGDHENILKKFKEWK